MPGSRGAVTESVVNRVSPRSGEVKWMKVVSGMSLRDLHRLGFKPGEVWACIRSGRLTLRPEIDYAALVNAMAPLDRSGKRPCLSCGHTFWSEWIGNRLCKVCGGSGERATALQRRCTRQRTSGEPR